MPRADPTFTGADIIRFWCNNLDPAEREEVLLFFLVFLPVVSADILLEALEDLAGLLPGTRGRALRRVIRLLRRVFRLIRRLQSRVVAQVFSAETAVVVLDCVSESDFFN